MTLRRLCRLCGSAAVCAVCARSIGCLANSAASDLPLHHGAGVWPGATKTSSDVICVCHTTGPSLPVLMSRIDFVVSGSQACVAGQFKAMNSFQEKMSTPFWLSPPCAGQACSGTVACAAVMEDRHVEPAQGTFSHAGGCGGAALALSTMKKRCGQTKPQRDATLDHLKNPPRAAPLCPKRPARSAMLAG